MNDLFPQLAAALAGRYHLERQLGRGGMATVYLAQDVRHDRPVALKVLHSELAATLGPERFQREIRLAARLQHPHILTVLDSGEAAGQLWFTMPFVDGEGLRDRLNREKQLPVEEAIRIVREAALALEYAHQQGVIHRDIKPENILLTRDGSTLVADFGIARAIRGEGEQLTQTGMAIGTPAYMSPEQATGERDIDARSDVYALGCVLYEMLAGEPPFTGPTPQAVLMRAMTERPRALHLTRAAVPAALDAVIGRATARTPADRFPSMAALAQALAPVVITPTGMPTMAAPGPMAADSRRAEGPLRFMRSRPLFVALALGVLIGGGVLFAWRRHGSGDNGEAAGSGIRLAVLPFDNLGDSSDAYFADGMTDEIRGKLAALPSLQVTAGRSAAEYRHSQKPLGQIAKELGVEYLLVGKVRWDKGANGASEVRVSPELIQVTAGSGPTTKWEDGFDATLTNVFKVQSDIAGRVAQALDLALGQSERQELSARPTQNLAAYDAYLHARETGAILGGGGSTSDSRRAIEYYERAVALDSGFAQAWSELSRVHSGIYYIIASSRDSAEAVKAADRALAIDPNLPAAYLAKGEFDNYVLSDWAAALREFAKGRRLAPRDADLLAGSAFAQYSSGEWEPALASLEEAARLDPRSAFTARRLARTLLWLRRYPEAARAADRSLALTPLDPGTIEARAMVDLAKGDLAGARAWVRGAPGGVDPTALVSFIAVYWDLYWLLDNDEQALLLRMSRAQFDNDVGWAMAFAQTYAVRGDLTRSRAYADTAARLSEAALRASPNNAQGQALLGLAEAYAGHPEEAVRAGEQSVAMTPLSKDAYSAPYYMHLLARIYVRTGHPDKALDLLTQLLKIPYFLSPGWLRIDPEWAPLRGNPRFRQLTAGS